MKLLVKVVEGEYSDAPQIVVVDVSLEFLAAARTFVTEAQLISQEMNAPVSLRIENNIGDYFMVRRKDLPTLVKAAEGPIADWDEFTSVVVKNDSWSHRWQRIEMRERCTVVDPSGIYFKGIDSNGVEYVTASLVASDITLTQPATHPQVLSATT